MDAPRTTLSLGPFEFSIRRREEGARWGLPGSIGVHVVVILLAILISEHDRTTARLKAEQPPPVPIPITFANPLPPQATPKPPPKPKPESTFDMRKPPPVSTKPLRMAPVPESAAAVRDPAKEVAKNNAGKRDTRPAGGEQGGPLPRPTAGVPEIVPQPSSPQNPDEPKDLAGRLRDFRHAVEEPREENPKGPKGGGSGRGGVTMPNLPATGYGVGNLEFEGRDYDWENYGRQIHTIIWKAWHNRLLITSNVFERWAAEHNIWLLDHRNRVRFTILKTGTVVDVAIETPSGCYPLDDSAADALREVVLPPLPDDFPHDREVVHAQFIAEGEIRGMGAYLQALKNAGIF